MPDGFPIEFETEGFRQWTLAAVKEVEREMAWKVLRALAFEFIKRVIEKTPVDFGRARAGWTSFAVHAGRSPRLRLKGDPKTARIRGSRASGVGTSATGEQAKGLQEGSFSFKNRGSEQFIEIVNGVPYIVLLEFGSSDQAPGGMMRLTFKEMQSGNVMNKEMAKEFRASMTKVNNRLRRQRRSARAL